MTSEARLDFQNKMENVQQNKKDLNTGLTNTMHLSWMTLSCRAKVKSGEWRGHCGDMVRANYPVVQCFAKLSK